MSTSNDMKCLPTTPSQEVQSELPSLHRPELVEVLDVDYLSTSSSNSYIKETDEEEEEEEQYPYFEEQQTYHMVFLDDVGWDSDFEHESPSVYCIVCDDVGEIPRRSCCGNHVCEVCLIQFVTSRVEQGLPIIHCPCTDCDEPLPREEVKTLLPMHLVSKYDQFLVDTEGNPGLKTCPRCSFILSWEEYQKAGSSSALSSETKSKKRKKKNSSEKYKVICPACDLAWCFSCHAPWHEQVPCQEFQKGQKLFKKWVKGKQNGVANAQRCPKCNVCIQRSTGCDHMTCSRCHCDFCYKCGKRMISLGWVGDHYSRYSVLGCKYNYKPDKPVQRKLTRGAIFSGTLAATPVVAGLVVGVAGAVLAASPVLLSAYGIYRLQRKIRKSY